MTLRMQSRESAVLPVDGVRCATYSIFNCEVVLATVTGDPQPPFAAVADRLRRYERRFSRFADDNELAALNHSEGRWVQISADLRRLLEHALSVAVESRGLVNISVTGALRRAGYTRPWPQAWEPGDPQAGPLPPLTEVLDVRDDRARLQPGQQVDFGAIAKGMWADEAVDLLGENSAAGLGGDVSARGGGPEGEGWPIGLPTGRTVIVRDGGVATSGVTKRRSGSANHIIDPRTGRPAVPRFGGVSVVARSATTAEWVATALLLGGPEFDDLLERPDVLQCYPNGLSE